MTTPDADWAALGSCDGAPSHADELMAGYRPQPTIAEQDRTHGAGIPAVDRGMTEKQKYGGPL